MMAEENQREAEPRVRMLLLKETHLYMLQHFIGVIAFYLYKQVNAHSEHYASDTLEPYL